MMLVLDSRDHQTKRKLLHIKTKSNISIFDPKKKLEKEKALSNFDCYLKIDLNYNH